jgi:hypothetical protein
MQTIETCPRCLGRGPRRPSAGIYRPGHTNLVISAPRVTEAEESSVAIYCRSCVRAQTSSAPRESGRSVDVLDRDRRSPGEIGIAWAEAERQAIAVGD